MNSLTTKNQYDFVVVGGGITGLALAFFLRRAGYNGVLLERAERAGGLLRTVSKDGFVFEHAANTAYAKDSFKSLIGELGLEKEVVPSARRKLKRYIGSSGSSLGKTQLHPLPITVRDFLKSSLLSRLEKLRLLAEPFRSRGAACDDESLESFLTRRFRAGSEVIESIFNGIWASDIRAQSARMTTPLLWRYEQEYGSLLKGILFDYRKRARNRPTAVGFRGGMGTLVSALSKNLEDILIYNASVERIERRADWQWSVEYRDTSKPGSEFSSISSASVFLALPAPATSGLLRDVDPVTSTAIDNIEYSPIGIVTLSLPDYELSKYPEMSGLLLPSADDRMLIGATLLNRLYPFRAPAGHSVVTCYSGGARNPRAARVTDQDVCDKVVDEFTRLLELSSPPVVLDRHYLPQALPNYGLGHDRIVASVRRLESQNAGLNILGNWIERIGVSDRIDEARGAVSKFSAQSASAVRENRADFSSSLNSSSRKISGASS